MCDDHDYPTVHVVSMRRARKRRRCYECGTTIEPGTQYERAFGVWDGTPSAYTTCVPCAELRNVAISHVGLCPLYGGLDEAIDNFDGFGGLDWQAIVAEFRARIRATRIRDDSP